MFFYWCPVKVSIPFLSSSYIVVTIPLAMGGAITETELRCDGAKGRTLECGSPSKTEFSLVGNCR